MGCQSLIRSNLRNFILNEKQPLLFAVANVSKYFQYLQRENSFSQCQSVLYFIYLFHHTKHRKIV